MHFNFLTTILTICAITTQTTANPQKKPSAKAVGIECGGSIICFLSGSPMNKLKFVIDKIDLNREYKSGVHVACTPRYGGGICVFIEGTNSLTKGSVIKKLFEQLVGNGCTECGKNVVANYDRFPTTDVSLGVLKVDYVRSVGSECSCQSCTALCA